MMTRRKRVPSPRCGGWPAPENHTGKIRLQPEFVLFIDAAQMDETRHNPVDSLDSIDGMSASSHSFHFPCWRAISPSKSDVSCCAGNSTAANEIGTELSSPVHAAVDEIWWNQRNAFAIEITCKKSLADLGRVIIPLN
jgi:hypothetical protein